MCFRVLFTKPYQLMTRSYWRQLRHLKVEGARHYLVSLLLSCCAISLSLHLSPAIACRLSVLGQREEAVWPLLPFYHHQREMANWPIKSSCQTHAQTPAVYLDRLFQSVNRYETTGHVRTLLRVKRTYRLPIDRARHSLLPLGLLVCLSLLLLEALLLCS